MGDRNIWVISDTHLNHANILNFTDEYGKKIRGIKFQSVQEMNDCILDNWNEVVKPGDIVYHLGDVAFGSQDEFKKLWPKFNGKKRLIVGNHDDIKFLSSGGFFSKVLMWRHWPEYGLVMSHVPMNEQQCSRGYGYTWTPITNVHGHIHHNKSPEGRYFNVSCEAINYTPINIEDLALYAKELNNKYRTEGMYG